MLIWPEEPQLVDLKGFAEMGRHDPVPLSDLTSKQSHVGHHSSVVVEAGVKHQGLKGVVGARHGPESPKTGRGGGMTSTSVCQNSPFLKDEMKKGRFLRGDSVYNRLENLFNICSKFG